MSWAKIRNIFLKQTLLKLSFEVVEVYIVKNILSNIHFLEKILKHKLRQFTIITRQKKKNKKKNHKTRDFHTLQKKNWAIEKI